MKRKYVWALAICLAIATTITYRMVKEMEGPIIAKAGIVLATIALFGGAMWLGRWLAFRKGK